MLLHLNVFLISIVFFIYKAHFDFKSFRLISKVKFNVLHVFLDK